MQHHDDRIDTSAIDNAQSSEDIDPGGGRGAAMALLIVIILLMIGMIYAVKALAQTEADAARPMDTVVTESHLRAALAAMQEKPDDDRQPQRWETVVGAFDTRNSREDQMCSDRGHVDTVESGVAYTTYGHGHKFNAYPQSGTVFDRNHDFSTANLVREFFKSKWTWLRDEPDKTIVVTNYTRGLEKLYTCLRCRKTLFRWQWRADTTVTWRAKEKPAPITPGVQPKKK